MVFRRTKKYSLEDLTKTFKETEAAINNLNAAFWEAQVKFAEFGYILDKIKGKKNGK